MRNAVRVKHLLLTIVFAFGPSGAHASSVIVPDQYSSISGGITSGADSVLVRYGDYEEHLSIEAHDIVLRSLPSSVFPGEFDLHPTVLSIRTAPFQTLGTIAISGFHVLHDVIVNTLFSTMIVENCRIDSTLMIGYGSWASVRNNTVVGDALIAPNNSDVGMNTVLRGTLSVFAGGTSYVHDNTIIGPAPIGIEAGADVYVVGNYVANCAVGISAGCGLPSSVERNVVEDCPGTAYLANLDGFCNPDASFKRNVARRCGRGFFSTSLRASFEDNVVEDCVEEGIRVDTLASKFIGNAISRSGGHGIVARGAEVVLNNRVMNAGGDGIRLGGCRILAHNVVGHSMGRGIASGSYLPGPLIQSNTSYSNDGAGFELIGTAGSDTVENNIAAFNAIGLHYVEPNEPLLRCNDWYANLGGMVSGVGVGVSDVSLNPLFCDVHGDNVALSGQSPLANLPGCGLVGALGVACEAPASVENAPTPSVVTVLVTPQPSRGIVHFSWQTQTQADRLEVYDVRGAFRWGREIDPESRQVEWDGRDRAGRMLPPGIYFGLLVAGSSVNGTVRIVLVR